MWIEAFRDTIYRIPLSLRLPDPGRQVVPETYHLVVKFDNKYRITNNTVDLEGNFARYNEKLYPIQEWWNPAWYFGRPNNTPGIMISSDIGNRKMVPPFHPGQDLFAPQIEGTNVYPIGAGRIQFANPTDMAGPGRYVVIDYGKDLLGNHVFSVYMHLNSIAPGITAGVWVGRHKSVGTVGRSGGVDPHLHFQLSNSSAYLTGRVLHPADYLKTPYDVDTSQSTSVGGDAYKRKRPFPDFRITSIVQDE